MKLNVVLVVLVCFMFSQHLIESASVSRKFIRRKRNAERHLRIRLRRGANQHNNALGGEGSTKTLDNNSVNTVIKVAVLLPESGNYLFRRELVEPGIEYALNTLHNTPGMLPSDVTLKASYYDSKCDRHAAVAAVNAYYEDDENRIQRGNCNREKQPLVLLGPVCNMATSIVSTFAEKWNVPLITSGAPVGWMTPTPEYPTLTRVTAVHMDLAYFLRSLFKSMGYGTVVPVTLIYEDFSEGVTTDRECHYLMQAIYRTFNEQDDMNIVGPYTIGSEYIDEDFFVEHQLKYHKVVLMCGASDVIRRLMLSAHKFGKADPKKSVWMTIDLHNSSHYGHGAWKRGDEQDEAAKEAYRALQVVSLHVSKSPVFRDFSTTINEVYRTRGIETDGGLVNEYVEGFHDSLVLYAHAIRRMRAQGGDIKDGAALTKLMRNVTLQGIAGKLVMDAIGDRHGDFSILAMTNYTSGRFESVYDYLGSLNTIIPKGIPRINLTMEDDYTFKKIISDSLQNGIGSILRENDKIQKEQHQVLGGILGTLGAVIICCMLIIAPVYYHRKKKMVRASTSENGLIPTDPYFTGNGNICLHRPLRDEGSVTTCNTTLDDEQKL